ncbi:MAG: helix-turn-helix domain-containing protein [Candidatus Paceibacterota bacterium]
MSKKFIKKALLILLPLLILLGAFSFISNQFFEVEEVSLTELADEINEEKVHEIEIDGQLVAVTLKNGEKVKTTKEPEGTFSETITNYGADEEKLKAINIKQENGMEISVWTMIIFLTVFLLLLGSISYFIFRRYDKLKYISSLKAKLPGLKEKKVKEHKEEDFLGLLSKEESKTLEFKSSLRWDHRRGDINKELEKVIAKTVAAFLNTEGGVLFIGVDDNGEVVGLKEDLNFFNGSKDKFLKKLSEIVNKYLGPDNHALITPKFLIKDQRDVCVIKVERSNRPVYLKNGQESKFYIRTQNSSMELTGVDADKYKEKRF